MHVQGKNLTEISPPYEFLNGDVYVVDNSMVSAGLTKKVYIWLGSKAFADDRAVGAWAAKVLDMKDEEIDIDTVVEGQEPEDFKSLLEFVIVTGDTPGFLRHVEVNAEDISYAMYRVRDTDLSDGSSSDDIVIENVPLTKESLKSEDVFVLDAFHDLYVWIGASSQIGEKAAGNRLARKLDVDRDRTPMVYVVHEHHEPEGFFDLISKLSASDDLRTSDGAEMGKGITSTIADLKSTSTPPAELAAPPPSGYPEVTTTPPTEPSPADLGLTAPSAAMSEARPPHRSTSTVTLYYSHDKQAFAESGSKDEAYLEISEATQTAKLMFAEGSSLILQRTASRQARGICKTGFLLRSGHRVGINCSLQEVSGEREIDDRLKQVGHHYR